MDVDVVWKEIPGFDGRYQASNTGLVRSLRRNMKISGTSTRESGHVYVRVMDGRVEKKIHIARLILAAFYGWPDGKFEACHNDSNPKNNHLSNLRWDTKSGNHKDRIAAGTSIRGVGHFAAKMTENEVIEARAMLSSGERISDVARKFNMSQGAIYSIKHRINWRHI